MRKGLIITYYWPPFGGSGVQRWLKFSKYLPENGWKPIIFTPENPSFDIQDSNLLKDIHEDIEICKFPIWEPYSIGQKIFGNHNSSNSGILSNRKSSKSKFLNWIRGNFFIPDPKVFWVKPSIKFLKKKISEENITHIISTGPPHSMHLISLGLKKYNPDLKWIADFRDPWSNLDLLDEFHLTKRSRKKHVYLENQVLLNADITLTVSETWKRSFLNLGSDNVKLITNGYDDDDFKFSKKQNDKFIIGHFGLLNHLRNPKYLWKTLNDICQDDVNFNDKLQIRLAGNIDKNIIDEFKNFPYLNDKLSVLGYITHQEVINEYNNSSLLLLLQFNSNSGSGNYPGKIFEYFAAKKPILAFGPEKSDVESLINQTNTGKFYNYDSLDINKLKDQVLDVFKSYDKKSNLKSINIDSFSRRNLTKNLSILLNNM